MVCPFSLGLGAPPASFCCPVRGAALHGKFSVASDTPMTCTLPFLLPWQELLLTSVYSLVSSWWAEFGVSMCLTHLSQPPSQRHLPLKDVLRRIMRSRPSIVVTGSLSLSQVWWEGRDAGGSIVTWRLAPSPLAVGDGRAGSSALGRLALLPLPPGGLLRPSHELQPLSFCPPGAQCQRPPCASQTHYMRRGRDAVFSLPRALSPRPQGVMHHPPPSAGDWIGTFGLQGLSVFRPPCASPEHFHAQGLRRSFPPPCAAAQARGGDAPPTPRRRRWELSFGTFGLQGLSVMRPPCASPDHSCAGVETLSFPSPVRRRPGPRG